MSQHAFSLISATALLAGMTACAQVGGSGVVPTAPGTRDLMVVRAIPIRPPSPSPSPSPRPQDAG
jgi:hypothetical protein